MDQHAAGMYYIACCNWLVDALLCMFRCTGLLQRDLVYNLQLFQQACKHTGLQLVSACDCFAFWSWDATLWHSCLYSHPEIRIIWPICGIWNCVSNCMSSSSSYPRQPFSGQNSFRKTLFCDCRKCVFPKLPSFVNIHVEQSASQSKRYIALHILWTCMGCMNNTFPCDGQSHTHCGHLRWTVGEQQIITSWNWTPRPDE